MIIAAHNEEGIIQEKIENCLNLDFGPADWEVIIVSDGSTDSTDSILSEFGNTHQRIHIKSYQPRAGKAHALNVGESIASGDVLIFSDANVMLEPEAPAKLLLPFSDPEVGAVCGKVLVQGKGEDEIAGESLYMRFEGAIQRAEARFWSMVGIDGALFALRRELYRPLDPKTVLDDFALSMEAPLAGQRIVYAEDAKAIEEVEISTADEFMRKSRIIAGGYQYFFSLIAKKRKMGWVTWFSFISHKVLRWLAPFFLIMMLFCNFFLIDHSLFQWTLAIQSVFYFTALAAHVFPVLRKYYFFYLPYYFNVVNVAALVGFKRYFSSSQGVLWEKVRR